MKKLNKALNIILIICGIILISQVIGIFILRRKVDMPDYDYTYQEYNKALDMLDKDYETIMPKTKQEYRDIIREQTGLCLYFYGEKELGSDYNAFTIIHIRTIIMDERLTGEEYCVTFAHETFHITKFSGNETYICFETFKYLYENEDEQLHNAGVWYGIQQLQGGYRGEYNCSGYIINYLVEGDTP